MAGSVKGLTVPNTLAATKCTRTANGGGSNAVDVSEVNRNRRLMASKNKSKSNQPFFHLNRLGSACLNFLLGPLFSLAILTYSRSDDYSRFGRRNAQRSSALMLRRATRGRAISAHFNNENTLSDIIRYYERRKKKMFVWSI